jgi:hypothetical protein
MGLHPAFQAGDTYEGLLRWVFFCFASRELLLISTFSSSKEIQAMFAPMKTTRIIQTIVVVLILGTLLFGNGCSTAGYRAGERTASTLQSLASRIENTGMQMDIAVTELDNLINQPQPDLRPQFGRFSSAVAKLNSLATNVLKADAALQARSKIHAANWEKELVAIQNDVIRANGQARKLEVTSRFDSVRNLCLAVQTSLAPVYSDLRDLQRYLNSDLTVGGLATIKDSATRVARNAAPARESVTKLVAELRALGISVSPQTGVAAPTPPAPK